MAEEVGVIRAGIPDQDDCPILTRLRSFIADQGTCVSLEHVFHDRNGKPIDLSACLGTSGPNSASTSMPMGRILLRIKEPIAKGYCSTTNPVWEIVGTVVDSASGVVRAAIPADVTEKPGIFELSWAVENVDGKVVCINKGLLSVERSLYAKDLTNVVDNLGPMTIQELRMTIMDSSGAENLRLDDVEFSDEQILFAMLRPIEHWNEVPPPIEVFNTRDFPFREHWRIGAAAQLHLFAANHYRRNHLPYQAGGISIDDLNREKEYLSEGHRLWQEYVEFVKLKKLEINMRKCMGLVGSPYGTRMVGG